VCECKYIWQCLMSPFKTAFMDRVWQHNRALPLQGLGVRGARRSGTRNKDPFAMIPVWGVGSVAKHKGGKISGFGIRWDALPVPPHNRTTSFASCSCGIVEEIIIPPSSKLQLHTFAAKAGSWSFCGGSHPLWSCHRQPPVVHALCTANANAPTPVVAVVGCGHAVIWDAAAICKKIGALASSNLVFSTLVYPTCIPLPCSCSCSNSCVSNYLG
jgi:hypothetical protein